MLLTQSIFLGNLHFNVTTPQYSEDVLRAIEPYIFEWTGLFGFHFKIYSEAVTMELLMSMIGYHTKPSTIKD